MIVAKQNINISVDLFVMKDHRVEKMVNWVLFMIDLAVIVYVTTAQCLSHSINFEGRKKYTKIKVKFLTYLSGYGPIDMSNYISSFKDLLVLITKNT